MKYIIRLTNIIVTTLLVYIAIAFISKELNPLVWSIEFRILIAIVFGFLVFNNVIYPLFKHERSVSKYECEIKELLRHLKNLEHENDTLRKNREKLQDELVKRMREKR